MNNLKICFTGVGSIAKRHIRNLQAVCGRRGIRLQMDAYRRNAEKKESDALTNIYSRLEEVPDDYDAVFITNPTKLHLKTLEAFHEKGRNFFIEKPLSSLDQLEAAKSFSLRNNAVYYVAGPLRYNAVIAYVKEHIDPADVIAVRCISSSYLPDWRPGQDYRETYSAQKALGGGVGIDLIHEWDYLSDLFGQPQSVLFMTGKKSSLEIDSEDYAIYLAEYPDKTVELHLDYYGRKSIRELELFTREDTVLGDLVNNRITYLKSGTVIDFKEGRDDYQQRELEHFLDMISGAVPKEDGYHHAIKVLELTQGKV